jgi:tetratricopeptide (TPR) repeat protein
MKIPSFLTVQINKGPRLSILREMNSNQSNSQVPAKGEPSAVQIQPSSDAQTRVGYLPPSEIIEADERISIAYEEGYDPLAIALALQPSETTFPDRLRFIMFTVVAAALVIFLFPTERFFKPRTKDLGTMTIGGPITGVNLAHINKRNEPWFNVLLEIDRLYFGEGKLSDAIRVAESALEIVPRKNWERWEKVHYRYWELLSAAGRVHTLKTASQAYLQILPENPFANFFYAQAFLSATNRIRSFSAEMKQAYRQEAESVIHQVENACNALNAQRQHPEVKEKESVLLELYQKLRLEQAKLYVLIWKLGGYQEDKHPDVVFRDKALDICDSAELVNIIEAKALKIDIYTHILDRWWWFEGQQVIQGMKQKRKTLEQDVKALKKELKDI